MRHCAGSEGSVVATVARPPSASLGVAEGRWRAQVSLSGLADPLEPEKAAAENQLLRRRTISRHPGHPDIPDSSVIYSCHYPLQT
jgi:hypothetical protein